MSLIALFSFIIIWMFSNNLKQNFILFVNNQIEPKNNVLSEEELWKLLETLTDNETLRDVTDKFPPQTIFDDNGESRDSRTPRKSPTLRPKKPSIPLFPHSPQRRVWLVSVIAATRTTVNILPHFIDYYLNFGVERENFLLTIQLKNKSFSPNRRKTEEKNNNVNDDILALAKILSILSKYNITSVSTFTGDFVDVVKWNESLLSVSRANVTLDDWILEVDVDEFVEPTEHMSVHELWRYVEAAGITFVPGFIIDRVRGDGSLDVDVHYNDSLWRQFPVGCDVTASVGLGNTDKIPLHRAFLMTTAGSHSLASVEYAQSMGVWNICPYSKIHNVSSIAYRTPKNERYWLRINSFKWVRGVVQQLKETLRAYYFRNDSKWKESGRLLRWIILYQGAVKCRQYWPDNIKPLFTPVTRRVLLKETPMSFSRESNLSNYQWTAKTIVLIFTGVTFLFVFVLIVSVTDRKSVV